MLVKVDEYDDFAISICPKGTQGEVIELSGLVIVLPAQPPEKEIAGNGRSVHYTHSHSTKRQHV